MTSHRATMDGVVCEATPSKGAATPQMTLLTGSLWKLVKRQRASSSGAIDAPVSPALWCRSNQELQTLMVGPVVLEGEDDAYTTRSYVPPSTSDLPAEKLAP